MRVEAPQAPAKNLLHTRALVLVKVMTEFLIVAIQCSLMCSAYSSSLIGLLIFLSIASQEPGWLC